MNLPYDEDEEEEIPEIAPDTPLPTDLAAYLKQRTEQRQRVVATTDRVTTFFISWSLNATGFFIARFLLFTGGGINFWLAISLCFSICSVSSLVGIADFRLNYKDGVEIDHMERLIKVGAGIIISGGVTAISVQEYRELKEVSYEVAYDIQRGINEIEGKNPELAPWLNYGIPALIVFSIICMIFRR